MEYVQAEVDAVRSGVGLNDISPMGKFMVTGPGAEGWLDRILANSLPKQDRIKLAVHCNAKGGVLSAYTVIRLAIDRFYLVSSPNWETFNWEQLRRLLPDDGSVRLENVTEALGIFTLNGPTLLCINDILPAWICLRHQDADRFELIRHSPDDQRSM